MQKDLDKYIETKQQLKGEPLLERKLLAFQVELAELANETRCFKFWSEKEPSACEVILEEYVDGIHFLLSVGIEFGFDNQPVIVYPIPAEATKNELVETFFNSMEAIVHLREEKTRLSYENLFRVYLSLGAKLGFSSDDVEEAYLKKNEVNHQRQDQGY
ncbi:dUTP diphosphatase [Salipaludibacillus sp. HK11]|uniref:dUTP diphosphatase n=1 Tax=Salipaludibacillus sp. HK11 TaxID=3394320 RepID=UPI0039FD0C5D